MASSASRDKLIDSLVEDFRAGVLASTPRVEEALSHDGGQASISCTVEFRHKPAKMRKGEEVAPEGFQAKVTFRERIPFEPRVHDLALDGGQLRLL